MTHYEAIKNMSLKQMAYTFYIFVKPFLEDFTDEEKKAVYEEVVKMLEQEAGHG